MKRIVALFALLCITLPLSAGSLTSGVAHAAPAAAHATAAVNAGQGPTTGGSNVPCYDDKDCGNPNCGEGRPNCCPPTSRGVPCGCPPHPNAGNSCHPCPPPGYNGGECHPFPPPNCPPHHWCPPGGGDTSAVAVPGTSIKLREERVRHGASEVVVSKMTLPHQASNVVAFKLLAVGPIPALGLASGGTLYQYNVKTGKTLRIRWITGTGIYEVAGSGRR